MTDSDSGGIYRSTLERDGCIRWMLNPDVADARLQRPRIINPDSDGAWRRYTGDLLVSFHAVLNRRPLVIEFKYDEELKRLQKVEPKRYLQIAAFLESKNRDFLPQTELDVRSEDFPMMRFVWDYRNITPSPASDEIIDCVKSNPGISVAEVGTVLRLDRLARLQLIPEIWRLVAVHRLRVDFKKTLDQSAKLQVGAV